MFGLLKKKLSGFVDKLIKREEKKEPVEEKAGHSADFEKVEMKEEKPAPAKELQKPADERKGAPTIKAKEVAGKEGTVGKEKELVQASKKQASVEKGDAKGKTVDEVIGGKVEVSTEKVGKELEVGEGKIAEVAEEKKPVEAAKEKPVGVGRSEKLQIAEAMEKPVQKMQTPCKDDESPGGKKEKAVKESPGIAVGKDKGKGIEKKAKKGIFASIWPFSKKEEEPEKKQEIPADIDFGRLQKKADGKRKMEVKMGLGRSVAALLSREVEISESDVNDLAEELELSMLEADVAYDVSLEVAARLKKELVGMRVPKGKIQQSVKDKIAQVMASVLTSGREFDFLEKVRELPKPAKILFVGPNGAGKTTTMAKIAHLLAKNGISCVFSASDTFRAAAIEQLEVHAKRLGAPLIKSKYGADPASVAFDAVKYAKAHGIGVVLIDSAGRQDTNTNLLDELKKIVRIIKPDLKIYIGESIGGNAVIDQIKGFNDSIGIDGTILTKLDCDVKGGTAISVCHSTGTPILYFGVGQGYDDLKKFDAQELAKSLVEPPVAS